jgi:cupin 2 domain-containing protein
MSGKTAWSLPLLRASPEAHCLHNMMKSAGHLYENIPDAGPQELFTELLSTGGVRIERIVSFGQSSPDGFWYDQPGNEWILLLEGAATLAFPEKPSIDLVPGDYLNLPAGCRHRVEKTAPNVRTVWLAVFY